MKVCVGFNLGIVMFWGGVGMDWGEQGIGKFVEMGIIWEISLACLLAKNRRTQK